jgi:MFS family permease
MSAFVQKHLKYNYILQIVEASMWGFGSGLASSSAVIPLFLTKYTDSAILFGLIPAIQTIGFQLPQLFMARQVASQNHIKPMVMKMTIHERIPFLGMAAVALFADRLPPAFVILFIFMMITWQGIGAGLTGNAWQNMVAKVIPSEVRSMFFSLQGAGVNFLTSAGVFIAGLLLDKNSSNIGYFLCFLLAFGAMGISYVLLSQVKEEGTIEPLVIHGQQSILTATIEILKNDVPFRSFVLVRFLIPFGTMASALFTIYTIHQFNADEKTIGLLASLMFISTVISGLLLGWLSDRVGRKFAMLVSLVIIAATPFLALAAQSIEWFYLIFILTGFINGSFWSVFLSFSLEFGNNQTRPTYVGMVNTLIAPSTLIAQLIGGYLADAISYKTTFLTAGVFGIAIVIITFLFVKLPDQENKKLPA